MTNEPKSNNQNKNQKRVIATLLILVAAVVIVLPNYVSEPWVTDASQTDFSSPSPAVSPSSAAEKTKYRQDAQSLLAEIINVRDRSKRPSRLQRWGELTISSWPCKECEVGEMSNIATATTKRQ